MYRNYFNIDPEYFPVVNQAVIDKNPDVWKKFFPHKTFVGLLKRTVDVLSRKQRLSIWVEGAYGTGKSHAVLTLKKLLDAGTDEVQTYFDRYCLDNDLQNRFLEIKSHGTILTVHRYGSSSIHGDHNLIYAIQESVEKALIDAGITNKGGNSLKAATLNWLKDKHKKSYFNSLITDTYRDLFGGDTVDAVIERLETGDGEAAAKTMDAVFKVADMEGIRLLSMGVDDLCAWLTEVIDANGLKALVFIWDEFTEYFYNNSRNLTGFQRICELSATVPFYFVLVTHVTQGLFGDGDEDFSKLNDRFVSPHSQISLPENIAFQLIGAAMEKKDDAVIRGEWEDTVEDLVSRTQESRHMVQQMANIHDDEMRGILPIHPYAALLLKHISSVFDSNQRSMFDFIKNDRGDEVKGFQWFINMHGPLDENPLLTIDMLWDFFYEKGNANLSHDVKSVLDYFPRVVRQKLDLDQQRVLKAILLLLAISQHAGDAVDLFIPNEKNVASAFEGTDLEDGAVQCAKQLVERKVLFLKQLSGGKAQYAVYNNESEIDLRPFEAEVDRRTTSAIINEELSDRTRVCDAVTFDRALKLRFVLRPVSATDFDSTIKSIRNQPEKYQNKIVGIVCYAKDESESILLGRKISDAIRDGSYDMVFIDTSRMPLGPAEYQLYRRSMAFSKAQVGRDNTLSTQYGNDAKDALKKWKERIARGEFIVYSSDRPEGERAATFEALTKNLEEINRRKFPDCLESAYAVTTPLYTASALKQGVECACNLKTGGTYASANPQTKLENALQGAWGVANYWTNAPHLLISKIKTRADEMIRKGFAETGRVSIRDIYDGFKVAPYGFMPCNLTAFILGFVLREYADESYSWSDGMTTETLTIAKLKEMVAEVISLEITPNPRAKEKYIVAMTAEEKAFNELTAESFGIPLALCSSIASTRERIRGKMKEFGFPIWTLRSILDRVELSTDPGIVAQSIERYCGIANSNNLGNTKSDNDIAIEIGRMALANRHLTGDLKRLLTKENCIEGMKSYLRTFEDGALVQLAEMIHDADQYINVLRRKFDADASVWVWNVQTVEQKIREVILDYRIISESGKINSCCTSYDDAIREWKDKCDYVRIAYQAGKTAFGDCASLVTCLYDLQRSGQLNEAQKKVFLESLTTQGEAFRAFYNNQEDVFKSVCAFYLDGLAEEEIREVYAAIPKGVFTREKSEYYNLVDATVKSYKDNLKSAKLKKLWREQTGTDSPREWSRLHQMPILCLVPDAELMQAKDAFAAINRFRPEEALVERACAYFEHADFFKTIKDPQALDEAFRTRIIKNFSVMLQDVQEVKEYLGRQIPEDPYEWLALPLVETKLRQLAEMKYNQGGYDAALEKVEQLSIDDLKNYLKELIKDNMIVGMEIIKGN